MAMNGGRADYMDGGMQGMEMNMGMNGGGGMGMNGRGGQGYRPPEMRRGICRDYHSKWPVAFVSLSFGTSPCFSSFPSLHP